MKKMPQHIIASAGHSFVTRSSDTDKSSFRSCICIVYFCLVLTVSFLLGCSEQKPSPSNAPSKESSEKISSKESDGVAAELNAKTEITPKEQGSHAQVKKQTKAKPLPPDDNTLDQKFLNEIGIEVFESPVLTLLSDGIQPDEREVYEGLLDVVSQLSKQFQSDYSQIPSPFQLRGFVMRDRSLYLQAGLLPEDFANLEHGLNRGSTFWMNEQKTDYYRRHLMIHESVHCLMDQQQHRRPLWYMEGLAEHYAIHRSTEQGTILFGVPPGEEQIKGGFGRLRLIRDEIEAGRFRTISQIRKLNINNFYPHKTSYGWSWALCHFLATHPETNQKFVQLMNHRTPQQFNHHFDQLFPLDDAKLNAEWAVFASSLVPDYDINRGRIFWKEPLIEVNSNSIPQASHTLSIKVDRNWQSTGISLTKGTNYSIVASGRYSIVQKPTIWESEPQGISIDYVDGQPMGQLQAVLFTPDQPGINQDYGFLQVVSVGRQLKFQPERNCQLFFRVNDYGSSWKDNQGEITITVQQR